MPDLEHAVEKLALDRLDLRQGLQVSPAGALKELGQIAKFFLKRIVGPIPAGQQLLNQVQDRVDCTFTIDRTTADPPVVDRHALAADRVAVSIKAIHKASVPLGTDTVRTSALDESLDGGGGLGDLGGAGFG